MHFAIFNSGTSFSIISVHIYFFICWWNDYFFSLTHSFLYYTHTLGVSCLFFSVLPYYRCDEFGLCIRWIFANGSKNKVFYFWVTFENFSDRIMSRNYAPCVTSLHDMIEKLTYEMFCLCWVVLVRLTINKHTLTENSA